MKRLPASLLPASACSFTRLALSFVLPVLMLAGCGSVFGPSAPPPACPEARVVANLERMTQYRPGEGRDLTDVLFEARIGDLTGECGYDESALEVAITVPIQIARGPANQERVTRLEYFVAIQDPQGTVIAKRSFPVEVAFERNQSRALFTDELEQRIPLAELNQGPAYRVLLGFQLSEEQVQDNIRRARR
jgi:hypothetical protein